MAHASFGDTDLIHRTLKSQMSSTPRLEAPGLMIDWPTTELFSFGDTVFCSCDSMNKVGLSSQICFII